MNAIIKLDLHDFGKWTGCESSELLVASQSTVRSLIPATKSTIEAECSTVFRCGMKLVAHQDAKNSLTPAIAGLEYYPKIVGIACSDGVRYSVSEAGGKFYAFSSDTPNPTPIPCEITTTREAAASVQLHPARHYLFVFDCESDRYVGSATVCDESGKQTVYDTTTGKLLAQFSCDGNIQTHLAPSGVKLCMPCIACPVKTASGVSYAMGMIEYPHFNEFTFLEPSPESGKSPRAIAVSV